MQRDYPALEEALPLMALIYPRYADRSAELDVLMMRAGNA
jgi:hypothetical protein